MPYIESIKDLRDLIRDLPDEMAVTGVAGDFTMNASKENCRKAQEIASKLPLRVGLDQESARHARHNSNMDFLRNFLVAATAKLPSEKSFKAEKSRRSKAKLT